MSCNFAVALALAVLVAGSVAPPASSSSSPTAVAPPADAPSSSSSSSAPPPPIPQGNETGPDPTDNDPIIYEWEVVAPSIDSGDATWAPWSWVEDPSTVVCEEAPSWCENGKVRTA